MVFVGNIVEILWETKVSLFIEWMKVWVVKYVGYYKMSNLYRWKRTDKRISKM